MTYDAKENAEMMARHLEKVRNTPRCARYFRSIAAFLAENRDVLHADGLRASGFLKALKTGFRLTASQVPFYGKFVDKAKLRTRLQEWI